MNLLVPMWIVSVDMRLTGYDFYFPLVCLRDFWNINTMFFNKDAMTTWGVADNLLCLLMNIEWWCKKKQLINELSLLHYIFIHKVFFKERGVVEAGREASGPKEHFSNKI